MDTTEVMKLAMKALRDAEVPESLWPTALPIVVADIRGATGASPAGSPLGGTGGRATGPSSTKPKPKAAKRPAAAAAAAVESPLAAITDQASFFGEVTRHTGVSTEDLSNVFFINGSGLHLKCVAIDMGSNDKECTQTLTSLIVGAVLAGTSDQGVPTTVVQAMAKQLRFLNTKHYLEYIRDTAGFAIVGTPKMIVTKTGWPTSFSKAIDKVLKKESKAA